MSWEYVDSTLSFYSCCCITVFCFQKKKKSFSLRSIPKEYTFADISPNILMPISKFLQQLIY